MNSEFEKITFFFDEVRRQWDSNAELVLSPQFYALWEDLQKPMPFVIPESGLELLGTKIELAEDQDQVGYFCWDTDEMCPSMVVESDGMNQRVLFFIQDGEPVVQEEPPVFLDDDALGFGERLEMVYDVIAYTRETHPSFDVRELKGRRFLEALEAIAPWHDVRAIRIMRRIPARFRDRLVVRAVEEMAVDEVSNQLELPLEGNYAAAVPTQGNSIPTEADDPDLPLLPQTGSYTIPTRTSWAILRDLALLREAAASSREQAQAFILLFEKSEILEDEGGTVVVRLPVTDDSPLQEGDRLRVFRHGNHRETIGTFQIFIMDQRTLYGSLTWDDPDITFPLDGYLCALPPRSPVGFVSDSIDVLAHIAEQPDQGLSTSCMHALGFVVSRHQHSLALEVSELDASQQQAHDNAVNPNNTIVLIQGPPGTGKTTVLEHILRTLVGEGRRILVTAPSNTAVDNICRRVLDLPVLRVGYQRQAIAPDISDVCWNDDEAALRNFAAKRRETASCIYAGTHVGILRNDLIRQEIDEHGDFDAIVFDEAGMTRLDEFLLCLQLADKAIVLGDHQQLPPHPLPDSVLSGIREQFGVLPRSQWQMIQGSALQWLAENRAFPVLLLQCCYRCQNPRLMRFASTLFYNARVRPSEDAEYYRLSYAERNRQYPRTTLRFYSTSSLPAETRADRLVIEGHKPGFENPTEAALCLMAFHEAGERVPLQEITIIAPYRRQVKLLRKTLDEYRNTGNDDRLRTLDDDAWERFLRTRISTVDSFQGGESDAVIICYVRSNADNLIGFVDDPNRVNVAHTRCRRMMWITGDLECLKLGARNRIFDRMERAFRRDGEIVNVTERLLHKWLPYTGAGPDEERAPISPLITA